MASYTPNLNLLKKDPVADGNDKFNIDTMLNQNWNAIDAAMGNTTAPAQKLGLTGDLSVGASLGVLANIGNLHVWKRTVVHSAEIPAGYTLGAVQTELTMFTGTSGSSGMGYIYINEGSLTVNDDGTINADTSNLGQTLNGFSTVTGPKFVKFSPQSSDVTTAEGVYFIPSGATVRKSGYKLIASNAQLVTGYPKTPAGTSVDYVCSVDRNAYQDVTVGNTTYEYVGVVGDKARVQVLSYVGTGTYGGGADLNVLTFDFPPKLIAINGKADFLNYNFTAVIPRNATSVWSERQTTNYAYGFSSISWYENSFYYGGNSAYHQMNVAGETYTVIAFG